MWTWTWGTVWPASGPFWTEIVDESLLGDHPGTEPGVYVLLTNGHVMAIVFVSKTQEIRVKINPLAREKHFWQLSRPFERLEKDRKPRPKSDLQKEAQLGSAKREHARARLASNWQKRSFSSFRRKCNSKGLRYFLRKAWTSDSEIQSAKRRRNESWFFVWFW